jgi:hypothetical protein
MRFFAPRLFLVGAVLAALAMLTPALARADDDDGGAGGGGDRAFCAPAGPLAFGQCFIPAALDFDFEASSGPLGENPTGTFVFESLPAHWEGQVTCLQVTGNRASVGGIITAGDFVGLGFVFTLADNTPGSPDLISWTFTDPPPAANTPNCGISFEPTEVVVVSGAGDIVVQDNIIGDDDDNGNADDDDNGNGNDDDDGNANDDGNDNDNDHGNANDDDDDDGNDNDNDNDNDDDD